MSGSRVPKVFVVIPVFNRIDETLSCIEDLRAQRYPNVQIVVVDGGSTDDTVARLAPLSDVELIAGVGEQWWTGATWFGVDYALCHGDADAFVMLLNNDTSFGPEMIEVLVAESLRLGGAVAPIVRAADRSWMNSGVWIDWEVYRINSRMSEPPAGQTTWAVDVLEGRGTLVPLWAIRAAGNVNPRRLPHYAGDYEFSLRLAPHGCSLWMTSETSLDVSWDSRTVQMFFSRASLRRLWWELTDRRSFLNVGIHFALIDLAAPPGARWKLKARVAGRWLEQLPRRTRLRDIPGMDTVLAAVDRRRGAKEDQRAAEAGRSS